MRHKIICSHRLITTEDKDFHFSMCANRFTRRARLWLVVDGHHSEVPYLDLVVPIASAPNGVEACRILAAAHESI
jgi:hypothetical protein